MSLCREIEFLFILTHFTFTVYIPYSIKKTQVKHFFVLRVSVVMMSYTFFFFELYM